MYIVCTGNYHYDVREKRPTPSGNFPARSRKSRPYDWWPDTEMGPYVRLFTSLPNPIGRKPIGESTGRRRAMYRPAALYSYRPFPGCFVCPYATLMAGEACVFCYFSPSCFIDVPDKSVFAKSR